MGPGNSNLALVPAAPRIRIVVADPYPVIVLGLRKMLEDDARLRVVAEASTLRTFRRKALSLRPHVALLDWAMALQDFELTSALLLLQTSIIFINVPNNSPQKKALLRLGARSFLSKWCSGLKLCQAVVQACERAVPAALSTPTPESSESKTAGTVNDPARRIQQLTERERQLLPLVCRGLKNREIAQQLGIAESTVWHHLTAVFTKLRVGDRLGLAAFAYNHDLVLPAQASRTGFRVLEPFPTHPEKFLPHMEGDSAKQQIPGFEA